jgi:hypothetical protein
MQPGIQGQRARQNVPQDPALRLLTKLASADLATFGRLLNELSRTFPSLYFDQDGLPMYRSADLDCGLSEPPSLSASRALAAATSRGLEAVTSLFSFSNSDTTCFLEHADALQCVTACIILCVGFTEEYSSSSHDEEHKPSEQLCKQVELAVAFKSAGERAVRYSSWWLQVIYTIRNFEPVMQAISNASKGQVHVLL